MSVGVSLSRDLSSRSVSCRVAVVLGRCDIDGMSCSCTQPRASRVRVCVMAYVDSCARLYVCTLALSVARVRGVRLSRTRKNANAFIFMSFIVWCCIVTDKAQSSVCPPHDIRIGRCTRPHIKWQKTMARPQAHHAIAMSIPASP